MKLPESNRLLPTPVQAIEKGIPIPWAGVVQIMRRSALTQKMYGQLRDYGLSVQAIADQFCVTLDELHARLIVLKIRTAPVEVAPVIPEKIAEFGGQPVLFQDVHSMDAKRLADLKACFGQYHHALGSVVRELIAEIESLQREIVALRNGEGATE